MRARAARRLGHGERLREESASNREGLITTADRENLLPRSRRERDGHHEFGKIFDAVRGVGTRPPVIENELAVTVVLQVKRECSDQISFRVPRSGDKREPSWLRADATCALERNQVSVIGERKIGAGKCVPRRCVHGVESAQEGDGEIHRESGPRESKKRTMGGSSARVC